MSKRKANRVARRLLGLSHWQSNSIKTNPSRFGWKVCRNLNQERYARRFVSVKYPFPRFTHWPCRCHVKEILPWEM